MKTPEQKPMTDATDHDRPVPGAEVAVDNSDKKSAPTVAVEKAAGGANAGTAEAIIDASADAASRGNEAVTRDAASQDQSTNSLESRVSKLEADMLKLQSQLRHWA